MARHYNYTDEVETDRNLLSEALQHIQICKNRFVPGGTGDRPQQQQAFHTHQTTQELHQQQPIGNWRSDRDIQQRRDMITKIVRLLRKGRRNVPEEMARRIPFMAKQLEVSLYKSASSLDAYIDEDTLQKRLMQLAMNLGNRLNKSKLAAQSQKQQQQYYQVKKQQECKPTPTSSIAAKIASRL